jgi:signal transduction histidine kinase
VRLEVRDDGIGLSDAWRPGVGIISMRERATHLGGALTVASWAEGGALVSAHLPFPVEVS